VHEQGFDNSFVAIGCRVMKGCAALLVARVDRNAVAVKELKYDTLVPQVSRPQFTEPDCQHTDTIHVKVNSE
jgi:hypothetical protein